MAGLKENELATLLIQEHSFLKAEIIALTGNYKSHVQYFQIGVTAVVALLTLIAQTNSNLQHAAGVLLFLMYAVTIFVGYGAFTIIETQHLINTLGAYLSVQEDKINLLAGKNVVFWETTLCPSVFSLKSARPRYSYPGPYLFTFQMLIMIVMVAAIPVYFLVEPAKYSAAPWQIKAAWANLGFSLATLLAIAFVTNDVLGKNRLWSRTRKEALEKSFFSFEQGVHSSRADTPADVPLDCA